ncbi:lytic transglycosylase domain-containing protein [Thalassobaculum sp.]|uniref:lytic transglycosylase domain-containing protein n=1 Tax=Thalassobaculum sp. TaxID=2022740 RepID=UPI0032EAEA49
MNQLGAALFAVLIVLPAAEVGATAKADREEVRRIVVQEALGSRRVPPSLALAVAEAESDFVANAESSAGARGVMQIMPATGRGEFGVQPDELWEPRLNVQIGIAFLDQLIARYGERWDLALSHYNGGSRVGSGEAARVIPATRAYVDKVLRLERRNARDDAVRRMIAAAEGGGRPRVAATERLPSVAVGAARIAALDEATADWRPQERRRRFLALAEAALDGAEARHRRRGDRIDTSDLLERIDAQKQRFRTLLTALRGE